MRARSRFRRCYESHGSVLEDIAWQYNQDGATTIYYTNVQGQSYSAMTQVLNIKHWGRAAARAVSIGFEGRSALLWSGTAGCEICAGRLCRRMGFRTKTVCRSVG